MSASNGEIGDLIARVRARWRRLLVFRAAAIAALAAAVILGAALIAAHWTGRSSDALAVTGVVAVLLMAASAAWALWPARRVPSDAQVARFIEEREPSLDDRLVSAVDVEAAARGGAAPALAPAMLADAGRRASRVDPSSIVGGEVLRRAGFGALAAALLLLAVAFLGRHTVRQSFDALSVALFPAHVRLDVTPGDARVQAGTALTVEARLAGNTAPVSAQLQRADGESWLSADMPPDPSGAFRITLESLGESFKYRVLAGTIASPVFEVAVVRPPRVTRIDLEYRYPAGLGLQARTEEDGGDIYAPAGTDVRLLVYTDREAASGQMSLGGGKTLALTGDGSTRLEASLKIEQDDSYRVRVADREGMSSPGETEYFIRMLDDRPPEVRLLKPARDRSVTRLEEVDIQAEAEDDFGIEALDLVYSVRGALDKVVPLDIPRRATSVTGSHTLYLEELDVKPGDFVSYYVRARDLPRGRRSSEARSDIFFLEVKPFEQEFSLAQSQAQGGGGGGSPQIDDLVNAQKEVIVATWKLDRRAQAASGARSEQDIRTVAKAEAELETRVEETASALRESTMRDPRRRQPAPGAPRAGQTLPEEDAMTAAAKAMKKAVGSLEALKTKDAMAPELEALNHLLKAQADVKERQISRQTGVGGSAMNRSAQDLSSLFDKELAKHQQTNYETPNSAEQKDQDADKDLLARIRDLAQRQDELLRRQQELARQRQQMSPEELKRALETLTREQSELRQRAEEMARQMSSGQPSESSQQNPSAQSQAQPGQRGQAQQNQGQQAGGRGQSGQPSQPGASGQSRSGGQQAGSRSGDTGSRMREVSEEMRNAASELRREDPTGASARGGRALDKLRELERQMQAGGPDEQRRAIGDMQLEARQLADAQRQVSSDLARVGSGDGGKDALRRLAGEQDRLAERAQRLQENLDRQAKTPPQPGRNGAGNPDDAADAQRAVGDAARDLQRQRIPERMQQSAEQMRSAAGGDGQQSGSSQPGATGQQPGRNRQQAAQAAAGSQQELARSLDRLADRLRAANGPRDEESKKLTGQLARAQELRERMASVSRELEKLGQQGAQQGEGQPGQQAGAQGKQSGSSQGNQSTSSQNGSQPGQGQAAAGDGSSGEVARLRGEYERQLKEAKDLLDQLQRDERTSGQGGAGFTYEGQGMVLSAPGTEAFKQDFARWEELRRQATQALEQAESNISKQLRARQSKDRLAAGVDDRPPAEYSQQVDSYFKALAGKKTK